MDSKTREMVKGWVAMHRGDAEAAARWMSRSLRLGGIKACRELVAEALR